MIVRAESSRILADMCHVTCVTHLLVSIVAIVHALLLMALILQKLGYELNFCFGIIENIVRNATYPDLRQAAYIHISQFNCMARCRSLHKLQSFVFVVSCSQVGFWYPQ